MNRATRGVTLHADRFARATVIVMSTVIVRTTKTPRCHACCEEKDQQSRQRPQRCRCRDLNLLVPCRRPRRPRMRRAGQARHFSCKTPSALTRLQCVTRTASTLDAGLCAGSSRCKIGIPWCRASVFARRVARLLAFLAPLLESLLMPRRSTANAGRHEVPLTEMSGLGFAGPPQWPPPAAEICARKKRISASV